MRHGWMQIIAVVLALGGAPGARRTPEQDRAAVKQVFEKYLQTLNSADVELASQVWLQSPDVLVVTPTGRLQGWDSVKNDLYVNLLQKQLRHPHVEANNISMLVTGDAAWVVYDFVFTADWADGRPLTSRGWESHGYQRTAKGWRIAHLHYSVPAAPQ
jgi:ketosteroid isomerase-like protein